jgi:hypothetical protein
VNGGHHTPVNPGRYEQDRAGSDGLGLPKSSPAGGHGHAPKPQLICCDKMVVKKRAKLMPTKITAKDALTHALPSHERIPSLKRSYGRELHDKEKIDL